MLRGYRPEGPTSRYWFLGCYWQTNPQKDPQVGGWWFPDNNGFVLRNGRPVERTLTLRKGQLIDLFGRGDAGQWLASPFRLGVAADEAETRKCLPDLGR
jgi:hypothetical protein